MPEDPRWQDGSWRGIVECEPFGAITVEVPSRITNALTPVQKRSLEVIRSLSESHRQSFHAALERYAQNYCGDLFSEENLTFSCDFALVPYLEHAETPYIFLNADSPVDDEHGVCFLLRNDSVLCCCHGDMSLEFFGWDNIESLEEIAGIGL